MSSWKTGYMPPNSGGSGGGGGGGNGVFSSARSPNTHYSPQHQQHHQQQQQQQTSITDGPRNKCDSIVFEAIAKAAEIVVGSRCWIDPGNVTMNSPQQQQQQHSGGPSSHSQPRGAVVYGSNGIGSNGNNNTTNSSSRFNLLVPEVQGVRSILQRWKRALHVPLRLDVYYQHPDSQRELLERWCLEYAPRMGGTTVDFVSADPIVQLRQVCKNIVVWLRTLYCWSHMMPAQALRKLTMASGNPIGFSIYVVSEGQDDVSGLVSSQGFHSQGQPHSVLTPYGELGWKVFYAPKAFLQKLLPEIPVYAQHGTSNGINDRQNVMGYQTQQQHMQQQHVGYTSSTRTKPIPMRQQQQQLQDRYPQSPQGRQYQHGTTTAQSAPQHGHHRMYRRSNSDVNETAATQASRSYHHRQAMMVKMGKAKSGDIDYNHLEDDDLGTGESNVRGGGVNEYWALPVGGRYRVSKGHIEGVHGDDNDRPPTKNLSALSLALMMSDEQLNSFEGSSLNSNTTSSGDDPELSTSSEANATEGEGTAEESMNTADAAAAEKRRAALHGAPPQFSAHSPSAVAASPMLKAPGIVLPAAAGEYGYAYNSQIPHIHQNRYDSSGGAPATPNASNTTSSQHQFQQQQPYGTSASSSYSSGNLHNRQRLGSSPASTHFGATPPGYLLGVTPSFGGMMGGQMTPGGSTPSSLIPPRSAMTPPFVRPVGFVAEPPPQPFPTSAVPESSMEGKNMTDVNLPSDADAALHQHQTSLDLLHSSPFQYPPGSYSFHNSGLHQTLSSGGESTALAPAAFMSEFYHRSAVPPEEHTFSQGCTAGGGLVASGQDLAYEDAHAMPFAVDDGPMASHPLPTTSSSTGGSATPGLASMMHEASLVASICTAAPRRLALFDSKTESGGLGGIGSAAALYASTAAGPENLDSVMDSMADQLADFHSFGASLTGSGSLAAATASASS